MPIDEQAKTSFVTGFNGIARSAQLGGVSLQRLGFALHQSLDNIEPGDPVDLQPLFEFLVNEQKVPVLQVVELFVALEHNQDKLGLPLTLPAQVAQIPGDQRQRMLASFETRAEGAQTMRALAMNLEPAETAPAQKRERFKPALDTQAKSARSLYVLIGVLVLSFVGVAVNALLVSSSHVEPLREQAVAEPAGLQCAPLLVSAPNAICVVANAYWMGGPTETLRAKAALTKRSLAASGVKVLFVRLESGKIVHRVE